MEAKLKMELAALPEPETNFTQLEGMVSQKAPVRKGRKLVVAVALMLMVLLCGAGWATREYSMWVLATSTAWNDADDFAKKDNIQLPQELDGVPFLKFRIFGHARRGASNAEALLNPLYKPVEVAYGYVMREPLGDNGEAVWDEHILDLSYGTTENELWRYYFGFDENGTWTKCEVPESYEIIDYNGVALQVGDTYFYDEDRVCNVYTRWVHWIDENRQLAFSICESDYTDPSRVVACAKQIIDMNR